MATGAALIAADPAGAGEPAASALDAWSRPVASGGLPVAFLSISEPDAPASFRASWAAGDADPGQWGAFRNRRLHLIRYSAPLRVAQNEMVVKFEAPGAGRAIVSLELEY